MTTPEDVLARAEALRSSLPSGFRDEVVQSLYAEAERIAHRAVKTAADRKYDLDQRIDRLVTAPVSGLLIMLLLLTVVIWMTVSGAMFFQRCLLLFCSGLAIGRVRCSSAGEFRGGSPALSGTASIFVWRGLYR